MECHADKQNEWQKDERIDIQMEGQTDTWRDRYGRRDRHTDGRTDRQTAVGQANRRWD
jgi:hypothetical protein